MNLVDALCYCSDHLVKFGGHELAAGLSVTRGEIDNFRALINEYAKNNLAKEDMDKGLGAEIPHHLKSPNFEGYLYPHDYEYNYVKQDYLPKDLIGRKYYQFGNNKTEQAAKAYYDMIRASQSKRK